VKIGGMHTNLTQFRPFVPPLLCVLRNFVPSSFAYYENSCSKTKVWEGFGKFHLKNL